MNNILIKINEKNIRNISTENRKDDIQNYFQSLDYYFQGLSFYKEGKLFEAVECMKIAIQFDPEFWLEELKDRGPIELRQAQKSFRQGLDEFYAQSSNKESAKIFLKRSLKNFKLLKDDDCSREVEKILKDISLIESSPRNSNSGVLKRPSEKCLPLKN